MKQQGFNIQRKLRYSMAYTKVSLKPLQKIAQLKHLGNTNYADYECVGNMVTFIFQIGDADGEEVLQDLSIVFDNRPSAYLSEPYIYNNAGAAEEYQKHYITPERRKELLKKQAELMQKYKEVEDFKCETEYENVQQACQNLMNELDQQAEDIRRELESGVLDE